MAASSGAWKAQLVTAWPPSPWSRTPGSGWAAAALLGGADPQAAADEAGVELPEQYVVLALEVGRRPEEDAAGDAEVSARRKLRDLRAALLRAVPEGPLTQLSSSGGFALVPERDTAPWDADRLAELQQGLAGAARADVRMGVTRAVPSGIGPAVALAREVAAVARTVGLAPAAHTREDVAVEYQLSRPGAAADLLRARIAPLREHPDLERTLRAYLRAGLRRAATARELTVHPNTVDYRLGRIREVTGLDPVQADDLVRLRAALVAQDSAAADPARAAT